MLCRASRCSRRWTSGETCGGGGASTATCVVAFVLSPRLSVQAAVTVIGPGAAPAVVRVPVLPDPLTEPALAVHVATLTSTLSGLLQSQVIVAVPPACTEVGLAV